MRSGQVAARWASQLSRCIPRDNHEPMPIPHRDSPSPDELYAPDRVGAGARLRGLALRQGRGHRPDHDQPAGRSQRLPARRRWPSCATRSRGLATTWRSGRSSSPAPATEAFCSGGDQRIRGDDGYIGDDEVASQGVGRLDVGDLHVQIRRLPEAGDRDGGRATRSAAARSCTSSAICRSPPTTPASGRRGRGSEASTADSVPACWRGRSAFERRRRSGSSAGCTRPARRSRWGWSTPWCRWRTSSARPSRGAAR